MSGALIALASSSSIWLLLTWAEVRRIFPSRSATSGEPPALGSGVVYGRGCELVDGVLDQHSHVVRGEDLLLDGVEYEPVQLLYRIEIPAQAAGLSWRVAQ